MKVAPQGARCTDEVLRAALEQEESFEEMKVLVGKLRAAAGGKGGRDR